jgi:hypothetical protein
MSSYKCELRIEDFPSRYEIFKELERFLRLKHYSVKYQTINKENLMIIFFDSPEIALGFAEILTNKKTNVTYYKDIVINVNLSNKNNVDEKKNNIRIDKINEKNNNNNSLSVTQSSNNNVYSYVDNS